MVTMLKSKQNKPLDLVEITAAVPREQVNALRQIIMRYILDNNNDDVAFKLLDLTQTRLRDDVKLWVNNSINN